MCLGSHRLATTGVELHMHMQSSAAMLRASGQKRTPGGSELGSAQVMLLPPMCGFSWHGYLTIRSQAGLSCHRSSEKDGRSKS